jgi:hypothetical protein
VQKLHRWSLKKLMKTWIWLLLLLLLIFIQLISRDAYFIEKYYTYGFYPVWSRAFRWLFGWIPLSVGDLVYLLLILVFIAKVLHIIISLFKKEWRQLHLVSGIKSLVFFLLLVYVFFYIAWGLNYSRKGIAYQLGLHVSAYTLPELDTLTSILQQRLNMYAANVDQKERQGLKKKSRLFEKSKDAYRIVSIQYPFLKYHPESLKPSLFSYAGNVLGFLGYYNVFTGEGQVNTTYPFFTQPFTTCHEMAHQVGYAKENEANFVGYLACKSHPSNAYKYSVYFDLYRYAINEIYNRDSLLAICYQKKLHPQVIEDMAVLRRFNKKYQNNIEPIFNWAYNNFLKANNQPAGRATYNEVVAWLIAYRKKFGAAAL